MKDKVIIGFIFVAIVVMALSFPYVASAEEAVVIIANKNVPASSLSYDEIKDIFLGNKTKWDTGLKIITATSSGSEAHKPFLKKYLKKSPSQFKRYCRSLLFTGKGKMPRSFETLERLLEFVTNTDGAIGYIPSQMTSDEIKIISIN